MNQKHLTLVLGFAMVVAHTSSGAQNSCLLYATDWGKGITNSTFIDFDSWVNRYISASNRTPNAVALSQGVELARARRGAFVQLIKSDPQEALAATIPASVLRRLPSTVLTEVETRVSGIGDYTVLGALAARGGPPVEPIRRFVHLNGRTYRAYVYGRRLGETCKEGIPLQGVVVDGVLALQASALRELEPGETPNAGQRVIDLRAEARSAGGVETGVFAEMGGQVYRFASRRQLLLTEARLESAEAGIGPHPTQLAAEIMAAATSSDGGGLPNSPNPPTAYTTGAKQVLIIRVDFPDLTGAPYSASYIQSVADTQISPYYLRSSYQLTTLANTVSTQVYRMPYSAAFYATNNFNDQLHSDAEAAASANYTLADYDRIIVVFSSLGKIAGSQITYGGLAQIGGPNVWCNGEFDFRVIAHELGHTYGLYHANLWQVHDGNPISAAGTDTEYGDDFDTMGANYANNQGTDFNAWFKNRLGWLDDTQVLTVTAGGTYRVYAFDHDNYLAAPGETLAIKIVKDSTHNYWIGLRGDFTSNASMSNGVYVVWGYNSNGHSDLLDMTTPGNSDKDAGLSIGAAFTDPTVPVTFYPVARGGAAPNEYMDVAVYFGFVPPELALGSPARDANGLNIILRGSIGSSYSVESSPDFFGWSAFTNFVLTNSPFHFRDSAAANLPRAFYRAVRQ